MVEWCKVIADIMNQGRDDPLDVHAVSFRPGRGLQGMLQAIDFVAIETVGQPLQRAQNSIWQTVNVGLLEFIKQTVVGFSAVCHSRETDGIHNLVLGNLVPRHSKFHDRLKIFDRSV